MGQVLPWEEVLHEHAESLLEGNEARRRRARLLAEGSPELLALMDLAEELHAIYRPLRAPRTFREQLRKDLLRSFRRRYLTGVGRRSISPLRTYWFWGAVASILSVAAGGVGYYLHRRSAQ